MGMRRLGCMPVVIAPAVAPAVSRFNRDAAGIRWFLPRRGFLRVILLVALMAVPGVIAAQVQAVRIAWDTAKRERFGKERLVKPTAVVTSDGNWVAILDSGANRLVLLSRKGQLVGPVVDLERSDVGFGIIVAAAFGGRDEVILLDRTTSQVGTFRVGAQGFLPVVGRTPVTVFDLSAVAECGGKSYLLGSAIARGGDAITEVSADGTNVRSFGNQFGDSITDALGRLMYVPGRLLCLSPSKVLVAVSQLYPEVRAYDSIGRLLWRTAIPKFKYVGVERPDARTVLFKFPSDHIWHEVVSLFSVGPGLIAVQAAEWHGRGASRTRALFRTWLFSRSGQLVGQQDNLPRVLGSSERLLFMVEPTDSTTVVASPFKIER
jgi:hypothetical protein